LFCFRRCIFLTEYRLNYGKGSQGCEQSYRDNLDPEAAIQRQLFAQRGLSALSHFTNPFVNWRQRKLRLTASKASAACRQVTMYPQIRFNSRGSKPLPLWPQPAGSLTAFGTQAYPAQNHAPANRR
jgi:hypothetical protein